MDLSVVQSKQSATGGHSQGPSHTIAMCVYCAIGTGVDFKKLIVTYDYLIVALKMYHSLMVLAMGFISYDGLSIVSQDMIHRSAS